MKKKIFTGLMALAFVAPAMAENGGDLLVRVRAIQLETADKSDANATAGLAADAITVESKLIPEIDFTYFFTGNIAAELVLTYPQKHDVKLNGSTIGTFKHLPPTLTLQYHFNPAGTLRPYVGAGVNYTRISSVHLAGGAIDLERSSVGLAVQAGFDYGLSKNLSLNVDVKKLRLGADVKVGGTTVSEVHLDPWLFGLGLGKKF